MRPVSAGEVARIRDAIGKALMPNSCSVTRKTRTTDGAGGYTESEEVVATHECRLEPTSEYNFPREMEMAKRVTGTSVWAVVLPYDATILHNDVLTVGSRVMEVVGIQSSLGWNTEVSALCQERV